MKFIIFDLDDTLLSGDCEREWINFLFLKGLIKDPKSKLDEFDQSYRKGALDFEEYSNFIQSPIIGMTKARVDNYVNEFIQKNINNLTDKLTFELLNEAETADKVLIASGSHDYLVHGFTNFFKIDFGIGTSAELKNNICDEFYMTPVDFKNDYRSTYGAGFSIAPNFSQSAWFRYHNKDPHIDNLFFAAAGAHPGAGIPGVLSSAIVVESLLK